MKPKSGQTVFQQDGYIAEVLQSSSSDPFWYYIVQLKGSREIVAIDRCGSYVEAREAALQVLRNFALPASSSE